MLQRTVVRVCGYSLLIYSFWFLILVVFTGFLSTGWAMASHVSPQVALLAAVPNAAPKDAIPNKAIPKNHAPTTKTKAATAASMQETIHVNMLNSQELENWVIVNDTVMGGVSTASLVHINDYMKFSGELSMRNNGGFASTRRIYEPVAWQNNKPISISIRGDGRRYQFRLRTNRFIDGVAYVKAFETVKGEWQTIRFLQNDFTAQFRGRLVNDAPALVFSDITQLGFMLADGTPGEFELHIKQIAQEK